MSRSGYVDDCEGDPLFFGRWRAWVMSAIRGKRGQKLLRELAAALDAMPEKRFIANELENEEGEHCALGVVGKARGIDLSQLDPEDNDQVAAALDIAHSMACEIVFENDEAWGESDPEKRWQRMRDWVDRHLAVSPP